MSQKGLAPGVPLPRAVVSNNGDNDAQDVVHYTERRSFPRITVSLRDGIQVVIGRLGSRGERSIPINISRGGVKVKLARRVKVGDECLVRFCGDADGVRPRATLGTVRWVKTRRGRSLAGIQFQNPLLFLDLATAVVSRPSDREPAPLAGS